VVWLALPVLLFLSLVAVHRRVIRSLRRSERACAYYERGLARIEDRWAGAGTPGTRFRDPSHPNSDDLDLFGNGSIFELLCAARTQSGEETLAAWLRTPASIDTIRERQSSVAELRERIDLREDLALLGEEIPTGIDLAGLDAWGNSPPVLTSRAARVAIAVVALLNAAAVGGWLILGTSRDLVLVALLVEGLVALWMRKPVRIALGPVEKKSEELALFAELMTRVEKESFASPQLQRIVAIFQRDGDFAYRRVARLVRLIEWLNSRRNPLFAPIAYLLLWGTQFAFAIEVWRSASGPLIGPWLAALGELEALCDLATYAYEHPDDPFPEIVAEGPRFDGVGIGHPLIPGVRCVRNDVSLGTPTQVLVVSGSNMSGKSTLLRSVGVNAVLAQAGAPVRASRLSLSPLSVGATLHIEDSIQAGKSRFYAEITRMRQLVEMSEGRRPLLFLFDEIFHGTNSDDRRVGAEAVVRGLLDRRAIGLVTTHDLALARIADRLAPRAANVHFEDPLENGVMTFDYRMRPGVVQHSNALALMRAVGLDVGEQSAGDGGADG
jgi:hypothetical protein